jgi:hypothetical protein
MYYFFADIFIILSMVALLVSLALVFYSAWHSLKVNKRRNVENGIPVTVIGWAIIAFMIVVSVPVLLIGGFTNMCIITAAVMLVVATGALIYGKWSSVKRGITFRN